MHLKGKTALVTGSTSGIGLGIAKALAGAGARLIINGFGDADQIEEERQHLSHISGAEAIYDAADLTDPAAIAAMFAGAAEKAGGVDILVNNAGTQFVSPIEDFPKERWDFIMALNLSASFHCMQHAVPQMKEKGWGRIISTASAHGSVASPFKSAYIAAKHGLVGLSKTVALEVAQHGITVNCVSPGYVWTPLVENQIPDTMQARGLSEKEVIDQVLLASQPTKQFVTVEQIGAFMLFLTKDEAASITGANLAIDGGWTAM